MKIQLKRSNQLDGAAAKQPSAEQMEYGELAVNYNANDPAIFLKDSNNQIISININNIGSIDSGTQPPSIGNNTGDLFFDINNNQLLFWNGTSWVPLNTNLGYTQAPTKGTITNTSGTDADIPLADGVYAGLLSPEQYTKLLNLVGVVLDSPSNGLKLVDNKLSAEIATTSSLGTVKVGSGLAITPDGTLSATAADDFLTSVNLGYIQESDHNLITNDAGTGVRLELANTSLAGLMSPEEHLFLFNLSQRSFLEEVNLSYQANGNGPGRILNSGGDDATIPIVNSAQAGLMSGTDKSNLDILVAGGGGGGGGLTRVDLDYSEASDRGTITNTGGDNASIPLANQLRAGLLAPGLWSKLDELPSSFPVPNNGALNFYNTESNLVASFTANQAGNESVNLYSTAGSMVAGGNMDAVGTYNGVKVWKGNPSSNLDPTKGDNYGIGSDSLASIDHPFAYNNLAVGEGAQNKNVSGNNNTAIGRNSLRENTNGGANTAVGTGALRLSYSCVGNTAVGFSAMRGSESDDNPKNPVNNCTAIGHYCLSKFVPTTSAPGDSQSLDLVNTGVGFDCLREATSGYANTAVGFRALRLLNSAFKVTAVGHDALYNLTSGEGNTAIGARALFTNQTGTNNVAVGKNCLYDVAGNDNVAVGSGGFRNLPGGEKNTAIGHNAGTGVSTPVSNVTCLGSSASVSGSNQVQLGNSDSTTYAYGSIQNRSDARDKTDVRDTLLGLDFIKSLRPVDFRWDYREDYSVTDEETGTRTALTKDGTRSRDRFHHGLIAQEVKVAADEQGVDFAGYQDHSVNGGDDVLSIGYTELIAPLIKAVQELSAENADLKARIETLEAS